MRELMDMIERICKTPGAFYSTSYGDNKVDVSVKLPPEVSIRDMTDKQGDKFDDMIHDAMEDIVAKMVKEIDDDPESHWADARANDPVTSDDT